MYGIQTFSIFFATLLWIWNYFKRRHLKICERSTERSHPLLSHPYLRRESIISWETSHSIRFHFCLMYIFGMSFPSKAKRNACFTKVAIHLGSVWFILTLSPAMTFGCYRDAFSAIVSLSGKTESLSIFSSWRNYAIIKIHKKVNSIFLIILEKQSSLFLRNKYAHTEKSIA